MVTSSRIRTVLFSALGLLFAFLLLQSATFAQFNERSALLEDEVNTIDIVDAAGPSVVAVHVAVQGRFIDPFGSLQDMLPPEFRQFFPRQQTQPQNRLVESSGSGFLIDAEAGYLVTNYHVVADALDARSLELKDGAEITVSFPGEDPVSVTVRGANPDYDVALLMLDSEYELPSGVKALELADSDVLRVGQKTIAIGNPFGLHSTVTQGIVSAVGRELETIGRIEIPMIQTNAAINPGNSGGPLLDSSGRVIGVNTMIVSGRSIAGQAGNVGIGFAVPANLIAEALPQLKTGGFSGLAALDQQIADGPRVGVTIIELNRLPDEVRRALRLPNTGLLVTEVSPGSGAADAGLQGSAFDVSIYGESFPAGGDIITKVNGQDIVQNSDLQRVIVELAEGDEVTLTIIRDNEELDVVVTLRPVPVE